MMKQIRQWMLAAIPAAVGSTALWISIDKLSNYRCYLLDSRPTRRAACRYAHRRRADGEEARQGIIQTT